RLQWVFYASILLILVFEKRKTYKLVFGVFPVVALVAVFNPLTSKVVSLFFKKAEVYYVRLFSIIPVFYCMAHGMTMIVKKVQGILKLFGVCAALLVFVCAGSSIYRESWMKAAENPQKVPDEVLNVLAAIPHEDKTVRVALPSPLHIYARQVDGSVLMPYGRAIHGDPVPLLAELKKKVPNVARVMTLAGNDDVDYVVVKRSRKAKAAFRKRGYEPIGETEGYSIYAVSGTKRTDLILNEKRQVVLNASLDADGKPVYSNISTIATREYAYDRWGNRTEERYYDHTGRRVTTTNGFSGKRRSYEMHGLAWLINSETNLDMQDQPILASGRYETRYRYLRRRDLIEESYCDAEGRLMNRLDTGYAIALKEYDKAGKVISEKYFDVDRNPVACTDGYSAYAREYDEEGRLTVEKYYDGQGMPADNRNGFATWRRSYDEDGNLTGEAFLDAQGNTVDIRERVLGDAGANLLESVRKESVENSVGISYRWQEDGSCRVAGVAQGISFNNLLMGERPFYLLNGETYRVRYSSDKVVLRVYFYEDNTGKKRIGSLKTRGDAEFTVPQNCRAVTIRLWVAEGENVDETVCPRIFPKNSET
ncbi:MAG: RHS repeat protein, partial [Clostridia bacterium]|nr:RHS repeat protein [Clostridia bacterium]